MIIQKTLGNLKERPKDERVAVASGTAIFVVLVLFFAWAYFFFKNLQSSNLTNLSGGEQDQFNFKSVRDAQQQLQKQYANSPNTEDLSSFPDSAAARRIQNQTTNTVQTGTDIGGQLSAPNGAQQ